MVVFLTGFMGSGKTTLGRQLAIKLNYSFYDLDHMIEKAEELSVAEIFRQKGEDYFRNCEKETIHRLKNYTNTVIATGGGAPCFFDNMELMNSFGETIYLRVPAKALAARLLPGKEKRPLIAGKSFIELISFIEDKLTEREQYYLKAHHIIEGENINVQDILTLVFNQNL